MDLLLTTAFCYTITITLNGLAFWFLFFIFTQGQYIYTKFFDLTFKFTDESIPQDTQVQCVQEYNVIYNWGLPVHIGSEVLPHEKNKRLEQSVINNNFGSLYFGCGLK